MGVLDRIFEFGGASGNIGDSFSFFGRPSTGTKATAKSALTLSAFFNGVDTISSDIAKLPKGIYRKTGDFRNRLSEHPADYLISKAPNELMTAFDFWKTISLLCLLKGEAFVEIVRNSVTAEEEFFDLLDREKVRVKKSGRKLFYEFEGRTIPSEDILHFKGFSLDGVRGVGVIAFAAHNLGVQLDSQSYASDLYGDRGLGYGVIESEQLVTDPNKKLISEGFTKKMSEKNKFKVPVLDAGLKFKQISISPAEAQFIESNRFATEDVARWLNMPPHKLKNLQNSNRSNIYQQSIEYVVDCLMSWVVKFELELNCKLFGKGHAHEDYVKFNEKALLRGDLQAQSAFYKDMIYTGTFTRNEVRALEDKNPIDGLDDPLTPVNYELLAHQLEMNKKEQKADE